MNGSGARRTLVRLLYAFWVVVIAVVVGGAIVLQTLGPPRPHVAAAPPPEAAAPASAFTQTVPATPPAEAPPAAPTQPAAAPPAAAPQAAASAETAQPPPQAAAVATPTPTQMPAPTPPAPAATAATTQAATPATPPATTPATAPPPQPPVQAPIRPGSDRPGPIAAPDPALLQRSPDDAVAMLPMISADGRAPMQAYARGFDSSNRRPRVGLVFAGLGTSEGDSYEAIRLLPGGVTLAFSPYSTHPDRLLDLARTGGHEFLLSLPLEPQGYPQNDAGDHALLTGGTASVNTARLDWALGRIAGYAGTTGALSTLRGERFANDKGPFDAMLRVLAARGLFYIDPRPGAEPLPWIWNRSVDVVIDEPPVRTEIDAKLTLLEQIAREKGSALGLAGAVRPVTLQRVQIWANGLQDRGIALAPASAMMLAPAGTVPTAVTANPPRSTQ